VKNPIPFYWLLPLWAALGSAYFLAAYCYLWKKTGVNMWKIWWKTNANNLKTERRFADEIRQFPKWHVAYQMIKWGTLVVCIGYLGCIFLYLSRR